MNGFQMYAKGEKEYLVNERIKLLERVIPRLKTNNKILPLKIQCMEWELRALKAEQKLTLGNSLLCAWCDKPATMHFHGNLACDEHEKYC